MAVFIVIIFKIWDGYIFFSHMRPSALGDQTLHLASSGTTKEEFSQGRLIIAWLTSPPRAGVSVFDEVTFLEL